MTIATTCIGAFPKPPDLPLTDWFAVDQGADDYAARVIHGWRAAMDRPEIGAALDAATAEAVRLQIDCGIDLPTDGEIRRENYVHYQCRHMEGFDFETLTRRTLRGGAYSAMLPTIRGPVRSGQPVLVRDWKVAQEAAGPVPVKITLPGPMTIADTTADAFYHDPERLAFALAEALNAEVRALAEAGCRHIQIDEPLLARQPDPALAWGIDALLAAFDGLPPEVTRVVHMCCGYPQRLDDTDYPKADPAAYRRLARALDGRVDQISIEDAHRHNPPELFELFGRSTLVVGFVAVARSRVETVEEIAARMREVLRHLPAERLVAAPDCGLGFLTRELALAKLGNLVAAAREVGGS